MERRVEELGVALFESLSSVDLGGSSKDSSEYNLEHRRGVGLPG